MTREMYMELKFQSTYIQFCCIVYRCCYAVTAELSSCERDCMTCEGKNIYHLDLAFGEKVHRALLPITVGVFI